MNIIELKDLVCECKECKTRTTHLCYNSRCFKLTDKIYCPFHIKEYEKTVYTKITRKCYWPENLVSARPIKLFGLYLWTIYRLAKANYPWGCSKEYDTDHKNCKKHKLALA